MDRLFIIVKGGSVEEVYSTKSSNELYAEVLDFDSTERTEEEEKRFNSGMRQFGN